MAPSRQRTPRPGDLLLSFTTLASLGLLILNDRILKAHVGGWVTGKLSDAAGLVFLPLLLIGTLELCRRALRRQPWCVPRSLTSTVIASIGLAFVLVKLASPFTAAYIWSMRLIEAPALLIERAATGSTAWLPPIHVVHDATDLLVLPVLLVPLWISLGRVALVEHEAPKRGGAIRVLRRTDRPNTSETGTT